MNLDETSNAGGVPSTGVSSGKPTDYRMKKKIVLLLTAIAAASAAQAANISWIGGTADYTNATDWAGGVVPGVNDNAINDHGSNNVVKISAGNPDWSVNQIRAGNGTGDGAFLQTGQAVTLIGSNGVTGYVTPFRLGIVATNTGIYTLTGGSINYSNGGFDVGELGTGVLNMNGGAITGSGNFAANLGTEATPLAVTATVGGGIAESDFTWFEQGLSTANPSLGLPAAGTTFTSQAQADHSYALPPSYTTNNAVLLSGGVPNATITLTAPANYTGLSFLATAGNGPVGVNYTVHHADSSTETGTLSVPDWFGPSSAPEAMSVGARVDALGINFQFPTPANGFTGPAPYLWSMDIPITKTTSAVTSIDLTYTSGGVASILGVSGQTTSGGAFSPLVMTGFNKDVVVEVGSVSTVSPAVTDIVNQTNGAINVTGGGQLFVGNVGTAVYNLVGGSVDVHNYIALGRSSGNGTLNMTGGSFNQDGGGNLLVGTGFNNNGNPATGVLNQNGGVITCQGQFLCPENSPSTGTYNLNGTGSLYVSNWLAVGRGGAAGTINLTNGAITKIGTPGDHFTVGSGGMGVINQYGGTITNVVSDFFLGETASGTWNFNGGTAILGKVLMGVNSSASSQLSLNGGLFQTHEISSPTAGTTVSTLQLNGATLQANADDATFISGVFQATVGPGGAIIDSQGFNITIPQELDDAGSGGLTKLGTGTLTLTGANTYGGPNTVSAGILIVGTAATTGGDYTVANNAGFGPKVLSAAGQLNVPNLTVTGTTSASLDFDLGSFGNPVNAPLNVAGALNLTGNITVNIVDATPQVGQFPLVKYGSLTGAPTLTLGTLPTGISATLVNNTANNSIDLNITGVNLPRWDGEAGGTWDIGATTNWVNIGTGLPTVYSDGNQVLFDDSALGTTNVNITATVKPSSVTVNDSALSYAFTGSGKISGATGLAKSGSGVLNIQNTGGNDYTGPTTISGGVLNVTSLANGGSPSSIGAASANPTNLVINNATFAYSGPVGVTANRGFNIANTNALVDAEANFNLAGQVTVGALGNFIKTGPAQFGIKTVGVNQFAAAFDPGIQVQQGTLLFDGTAGPQTNHTVNEMWVGDTPASGGSVVLSNTTLNVDSWFAVGRGNGTAGNVSSATLYNAHLNVGNISLGYDNGIAGNTAFQFLSLNGNSTLTNNGDMNLCESPGSTATITINDNSVLWGQNRFYLPNGGGATGTVVVANSGQLIVNNGWFSIGNGNAGTGSLTLKNNANAFVSSDFNVTDTGTSVGNLTLQDNAVASGNAVYFGKSGGSVATVSISGGTLIARGGDLQMGASGSATLTQTAGTVVGTNWISIGRNSGGTGIYNLSGGTLLKVNPSNGTRLNVAENGTGTLNVSGTGSVVVGSPTGADLDVCSASGSGTVNLNGGSITAGQITHLGGGTAVFNFNGGTLIAAPGAVSNFMAGLTSANIVTNGATIDSGTNIINIAQALLNGTGGGGLTKAGSGTLYLNGVNTYTGSTLINAGALGGTGTIAGSVTVASGGTLAAGNSAMGTLTVNNALTFSSGSSAFFRINNNSGGTNNDLVSGLTAVAYNGTLTVSNSGTGPLVTGSVFKLFNSASAGTGNFTTVKVLPSGSGTFNPATGEVTITSTGTFAINHPFVSNGNLVVTATGSPNAPYTVLSTTNILLPLSQWTTNATGTFNSAGASSNAIPLDSTNRFFLLRQP